MKKCKCCGIAIRDDEIYFDIVVWEMTGDEGEEEREVSWCRDCKERLIGE